MIKPDAVASQCTGPIIHALEDEFGTETVRAAKKTTLTEADVDYLYKEHIGKSFYPALKEFTLSGPVVLLELEVDDISALRVFVGASDPEKADSGTLRERFGVGMPNNAVHCSDSADAAARELYLIRGEVT